MHLCFIDESGTPAKPGRETPRFFVIAGLVIPEERWHRIAAKVQGLKTRSHYRGEIKWRYFAPQNDDQDNAMAAWPFERRNRFREELFSILTADKSIQIVSGVCEASAAYRIANVTTQNDLYFGTYKVVTERFQYLLQNITRKSGRDTFGIIVADHRGRGDDEQMRIQHQRLIAENTQYTSAYSSLVEGLFLTPSHLSVGIQLADMVAGAIWRRFESDDSRWFDLIRSSFRKSPAGAIDGFGLARYPKRGWNGPIP
jgi:Protein of unknown function (DUF3800)